MASQETKYGLHPEFEGLVVPHIPIKQMGGLEGAMREATLWDAAEAAFARFNQWTEEEKHEYLKGTIEYIRENTRNKNRVKLPILEGWVTLHSADIGSGKERTVDEVAEEIWKDIEKGVSSRHEGMSRFLYGNALEREDDRPNLAKGGIWYANVLRRGDERKERGRKVQLTNVEMKRQGIDITKIRFEDQSPLFRNSLGRERIHGDGFDMLYIAGYHPQALGYWIKGLTPEQKEEFRLLPGYDIFMPFDFKGNENLVWEAVARRYSPISSKLRTERNLFPISNFLLDYAPKILSPSAYSALVTGTAWIGVGKHHLEDELHRPLIRTIERFFKEQGYVFNGFAVDFRHLGEQYQTTSIVYTKPDLTRSVHVIYDSKYELPWFLFKIKVGAWEMEKQAGRIKEQRQLGLQIDPFDSYERWTSDIDRHTQHAMVTRLNKPDAHILAQHRDLIPQYNGLEEKFMHRR
jgi:hypothetical protein